MFEDRVTFFLNSITLFTLPLLSILVLIWLPSGWPLASRSRKALILTFVALSVVSCLLIVATLISGRENQIIFVLSLFAFYIAQFSYWCSLVVGLSIGWNEMRQGIRALGIITAALLLCFLLNFNVGMIRLSFAQDWRSITPTNILQDRLSQQSSGLQNSLKNKANESAQHERVKAPSKINTQGK